ncbi:Serpentine Receptor, class H [Caenorhabditis elegans]|uniref:Serpentine Receptor, class H n=1 Tax=Caenorhabditis elegans TaxID=6239 RepID=O45476_CAEEL|nr:Serpentine Receptor, class H [Caenorhabditis elegans]CAB04337.1 Serpentine Receptor, class H [Caenorhabditis elegans]|eukprot:NP_507002.1 Serpentine Receptor, class I [Caenorhabditis elegans]
MPIEVGPDWYIYGMHFSAMITTPVNIFGVYVILFCQTKQLASYRWHLLVFQVCSMTSDFLLNIGMLPVIFSPFPMGVTHGIFTRIFELFGSEISTEAQCIMVIVSLFVTAGSVELLFFLRYQAILPASHSNKLTTVFSVIIILIWQIFLITLMLLMFKLAIPDQKTARAQFIELYPDLQYLVASKHVFIVCVVVETIHVIFLCLCVFRIGIGGTIAIVLIWMSSRALKSVQLSPTTRRIHLQLIRSLCYQIAVPILAFYIPIISLVVPLIFTIPNSQTSYFISLLCMSTHTFLGTLSMLYFNRHYRQWLCSIIRSRKFSTSLPTSKIIVARERLNSYRPAVI